MTFKQLRIAVYADGADKDAMIAEYKKGRFMCWVRKVLKGEKLVLPQGGTVYMKFLNEIKTDLTNGWIY